MMATEEVERTWMVAHVEPIPGRYDPQQLGVPMTRTEFMAVTRQQLVDLLGAERAAELLDAGQIDGGEWLVLA